MSPERRRALLLLGLFFGACADVQDGLGPFLGVHLQAVGWTPERIGWAMALSGFAALVASPFAGALADAARGKRALLAAAILFVTAASGVSLTTTSDVALYAVQVLMGLATALFAPAGTALTLGLAGEARYARQLGCNEAYKHAGTCLAAGVAGLLAWAAAGNPCGNGVLLNGLSTLGTRLPFVVMAGFAALSLVLLLFIPARLIDPDAARGLGRHGTEPVSVRQILTDRALLGLALTLFCFHLGNAAMLPLLGQAAVARFGADPTGATAQTILVAQLTMVPAVLLAARAAERFGWAPLVVTALIVLSVRGLTAGFWADPAAIYPVQVLDGVAAGVIGVATPGFVAAIAQGGGRANLALGLVILVQGIGAALSNGLAGHAAHAFGYEAAFLALAAAPLLGLAVFLRMVRATD